MCRCRNKGLVRNRESKISMGNTSAYTPVNLNPAHHPSRTFKSQNWNEVLHAHQTQPELTKTATTATQAIYVCYILLALPCKGVKSQISEDSRQLVELSVLKERITFTVLNTKAIV